MPLSRLQPMVVHVRSPQDNEDGTTTAAQMLRKEQSLPPWVIPLLLVLVVMNVLSLILGYVAYSHGCDASSETLFSSTNYYFNKTTQINTSLSPHHFTNVTEITHVHNIISNETHRYNVKHFGAVGDGSVDDTIPLQRAINESALVGGVVYIPTGKYSITNSLLVPAGVSIVGDGMGENPRDMSGLKGSVILYRGYGWAIRLLGDCIRLDDFVVYDNGVGGGTALGGVLLDADNGRYIESTSLKSILIFRFTNGTGLKLYANNGGAISYCSFYDVRVRNAWTGIHLHATGVGGAFTNSHSFYRGAISGGGFAYGLKVEGPGL